MPKPKKEPITIEELITEINKAQGSSAEEGVSTEELAEAWGISAQTVREKIRPAVRSGRIIAGRKYIQSITGIMMPIPCYRLKEGSK